MDSSEAVADSNSQKISDGTVQKTENQVESKEKVPEQDGEEKSSKPTEPKSGDEDVPENFFDDFFKEDFLDDFLKEDFMAGLDIIDEDNDESETLMENQRKAKKAKDSSKGKLDVVKTGAPKGVAQSKNKPAVSKPNKSKKEGDVFDNRRDPEKTRQAIAKDKMKSVKDKEKRLITDIVQTGLVPPGMELEVDISEVCGLGKGENAAIKNKSKPDVSEGKAEDLLKKRKRSSKESENQKHPKLDKKRSFEDWRQSYNTTNHYRRSSPLTGDWVRKLSPLRRHPRRSPLHRKRSVSPRSPKYRRRSKSRSFSNRRIIRRSRSRDWSPKYRRHGSPERRRSRPRKEEKMSFLEELAAKLNEKHPTPPTGYAPVANYQAPMVPLVQPYEQFCNPPAPVMLHPVAQPKQYDESFFIGNSHVQSAAVNKFEENFPPKLPVNDVHGRPLSTQLAASMQDNLFSGKDVPKVRTTWVCGLDGSLMGFLLLAVCGQED